MAATYSPDGRTIAVREDSLAITLYDPSSPGPGRPAAPEGASGKMLFAPDGTLLLATTRDDAELDLKPVFAGMPASSYAFPPNLACGTDTISFSPEGYVMSYGGRGIPCIWKADSGSVVATFSENPTQAVLQGARFERVLDGGNGQAAIVISDFSGAQLSVVLLPLMGAGVSDLVLSPSGDRVAQSSAGKLWDAMTGAELLSLDRSQGSLWLRTAIFTRGGDRVWLADGLFSTNDGARIATLDPSVRSTPVLAVAPDGLAAVIQIGGSAAELTGAASSSDRRVLGGPTRNPAHTQSPISSLSISSDGTILVSEAASWWAFGLRVADRFAESQTLWSASAPDNPMVANISANGALAAVAGDNRVLFDVAHESPLWPPPAINTVSCFGTQLRPSPTAKWAAGAGYTGTMDVFATAGEQWQALTQLPSGCHDAAGFSRDERLMATSTPALYRTGDSAVDWQPVWARSAAANSTGTDRGRSAWGTDVTFSPDEQQLLVSRCDGWTCTEQLLDVRDGAPLRDLPELTAPHPSYSPEGHWVVAGNVLLHLPSGDVRPLDPTTPASTAIFTPNGDVIAGSNAGLVTRYCRTP